MAAATVRAGMRTIRRGFLLLVTTVACMAMSSVGADTASAATCSLATTVHAPIIRVADIQSIDQLCGVWAVENHAYEMYAYSHDMPLDDPRIMQAGQYEIAGITWSLMLQIIQAHKSNPNALTPDERGAYDWLHGLAQTFDKLAAQNAIDEYEKWKNNPCGYVPPNDKIFTFSDAADPACTGGLGGLMSGPSAPSYQELIEMGRYRAAQTLNDSSALHGTTYQKLANERIGEAQASWSMVMLGSLGPITTQMFPDAIGSYIDLVTPHTRFTVAKGLLRAEMATESIEQELAMLEEATVLEEAGSAADPLLEVGAEEIASTGADIGIDLGEAAAELGAESLGGPLIIGGIAAAILIQESIKIADAENLPHQLQANLNTSVPELADVIAAPSGGGFGKLQADFIAQLSFPTPAFGTTADGGHVITDAPDDGSRFQVSHADDSGTTRYTEFLATFKLATWPLGIDQGAYGPPQETISYNQGQIWRKIGSHSDDALAGLSGYVPSGELHYYDWSGHPRIAIVKGHQFLDLSAPGSISVGGRDANTQCSGGDAECHPTTVLFALERADAVTPSLTTTRFTNGGFTEVRETTPSDGTVLPPYRRVRLSIKPNEGTPPVINIDNRFGKTANTGTTPPDGGAWAGDTAYLEAPVDNRFGYATDYIWHVETRCAHDANPAHAPKVVDGVPFCFGAPEYNMTHLPADEADLSTCATLCTADPAFHGNPVATYRTRSATHVWPTAGTFHVRLKTKDSYGVQRRNDVDKTITAVAPRMALSSSMGMVGASVYGPVTNGDTVTVSGCISHPSGAALDPTVSLDWGDGTTDTAFGTQSLTGSITFHLGATGGCSQPWSFTATHTYNVTPPGVFEVQKALHFTVSDGFGHDTTYNPFVNLQFTAPPVFTTANHATFTAGQMGTFTIVAGGMPTPSWTVDANGLPPGLGLVTNANGTATVSGTPSITQGGTYDVTLTATNVGGTAQQTFTLTVLQAPKVTSGSSYTIAEGATSTFTATTSGFPKPDVSIVGTLPGGMMALDTINGDGTAKLLGAPDAGSTGVYPLTVRASNGAGAVEQRLTLTVGTGPSFTTSATAGFIVGGAPRTFTIRTKGSPTAALTCSPCTLPSGLAFADNGDGSAQVFGATSAAAGSYPVTIHANSDSGSATQNLTVNVSASGGPNLVLGGTNWTALTSTELFAVGFNTASMTIDSSDATSTLEVLGTIPTGLTFADAGGGHGSITGTPAAGTGGWYNLIVIAHTAGSPDSFAFARLEVWGSPAVTSGPRAVFTEGTSGTFTVRANALPVANVYQYDGTLPSGLTLTNNNDNTATLTGTPAPGSAGSYPITIEAKNQMNLAGPVVHSTLDIEVETAPHITSAASTNFSRGDDGSFTVTTTGYPTPTLTVSGTLPTGVTFVDNGDGTGSFAGTPTDADDVSASVTIHAGSAAGDDAQVFTLGIGARPVFDSPDAASFTVGDAGSFTVRSSTLPTPTFAQTGLPAGVTLTDNGDGTATIAGTPDPGTGALHVVHVTAHNTYGTSTQDLALTVSEAPTYLGVPGGLDCSTHTLSDSTYFLGLGSWTLCTSGYPTPVLGIAGDLPDGVTYTDNHDGSITIEGEATPGHGGSYPATLVMINGAGTTTHDITLEIREQAAVTGTPAPVFIPGDPNSFTIETTGAPRPTFTVTSTLPGWLTFTDNNDGTATLAGTPPIGLMTDPDPSTRQVGIDFDLDQTVGNGGTGSVPLTVASMKYVDHTPPAPVMSVPYSYQFTTTDQANTTYTLAPDEHLPAGLALAGDGTISGTPTTVGTWKFHVIADNGETQLPSGEITMQVHGGTGQLMVQSFRLYGPGGRGDWFVTMRNMTSVTTPVYGWRVEVWPTGALAPQVEKLPAINLAPGADVTVSGPTWSLAPFGTSSTLGPLLPVATGGVRVVAPDMILSDSVGETGADASTIEGTPLPAPAGADIGAQKAFFRHTSAGQLVDTDNNAADFSLVSTVRAQTIAFTSKPPLNASPGMKYAPRTTPGGSTKPVVFSIGTASTKGACTAKAGVVTFRDHGTCIVEAHQPGDLRYTDSPVIKQSIFVHGHRMIFRATGPRRLAHGRRRTITITTTSTHAGRLYIAERNGVTGVGTAARRLRAGTQQIRLTLGARALRRGVLTITLRATSGHQVVTRTLTVRIR